MPLDEDLYIPRQRLAMQLGALGPLEHHCAGVKGLRRKSPHPGTSLVDRHRPELEEVAAATQLAGSNRRFTNLGEVLRSFGLATTFAEQCLTSQGKWTAPPTHASVSSRCSGAPRTMLTGQPARTKALRSESAEGLTICRPASVHPAGAVAEGC